jgi:transposase-like protein
MGRRRNNSGMGNSDFLAIVCPNCEYEQSDDETYQNEFYSVRDGFIEIKTKAGKKIRTQRYHCKNCNTHFTLPNKAPDNSPETESLILHFAIQGMSDAFIARKTGIHVFKIKKIIKENLPRINRRNTKSKAVESQIVPIKKINKETEIDFDGVGIIVKFSPDEFWFMGRSKKMDTLKIY